MSMALCNAFLQYETVQELINSNQTFDLILGEIFLDESILAGFSHKFKAPIVAVQTFMQGVWANYIVSFGSWFSPLSGRGFEKNSQKETYYS